MLDAIDEVRYAVDDGLANVPIGRKSWMGDSARETSVSPCPSLEGPWGGPGVALGGSGGPWRACVSELANRRWQDRTRGWSKRGLPSPSAHAQ